MPRRTGRDSGSGRFITETEARQMGDKATIETIFDGRITPRMHAAGYSAVRKWAQRPLPAVGDRSEDELVDMDWDVMWAAMKG